MGFEMMIAGLVLATTTMLRERLKPIKQPLE